MESMARAAKGTKQKFHPPDFLLTATAVVILAFGLVMVLSAGARFSYQNLDNVYVLFSQQFKSAMFGLAAAVIVMLIPFAKWRRVCGMAVLAVAVLLILVNFTPLGVSIKGAARWIDLGFVKLQPSELAKLAIIMFLAHNFDRYPVGKLRDAFGSCLLILPVVVLVLINDLGTTIVIIATIAAMLLQTGLPLRYFVIGTPVTLTLGGLYIAMNDYQRERITGWLDPWHHLGGSGYQTALSEYVLAVGGFFGVGIGENTEYSALPENYNDMIFSVIGQEFGFFGAFVFLLVLVFFIARCFYVSSRCENPFGRLLGFGLSSMLGVQCCINICASIGVLPITGITLPLVSYGGTSLLITMVEIGILLNISRYMTKSHTVSKHRLQAKTAGTSV